MSVTIIAAIITASVTLAVTFVPLLLKYLNDKKKFNLELEAAEAKVNLIVSTGIAIGYYYNFIKPIFERLSVNDEIEIEIDKKGAEVENTKRTFKSNKVEVQIILPIELTKIGIEAMRVKANEFRKGSVLRKDGIRDFAIKLFIDNENDRLIIVDVANPLNAVGQYLANLEEYKSIITSDGTIKDGMDTQAFRNRQKKEIANFKEVIKYYARFESYGNSQLLFKE